MAASALFFFGLVSASLSPVMVARADTTATSTVEAFESLTGCHEHGTVQYCMDGETEYRIIADATATGEAPSSYTDCHNHGTDTYCMSPSGGEVQVVDADASITSNTAEATAKETGSTSSITAITDCHLSSSSVYCSADSTEYYVQTTITATGDVPAQFTGCHSHGDETHCTGGSSEESESSASCERTDRDYKIPIRIGMLFVVLVASSIGVFGPILMSNFVQVKTNLFLTVLKQFGTGVIISTAFVHLFTHASMMFGNECLGELKYEATTAAIVMAGLFISFLIEFFVTRAMRWQAKKKSESDEAEVEPSSKAVASAELANISIMEAGIIFHSLLIGITLVVAGDSFFVTLAIVIIFHQMFEGIALGTRIAALGHGATFSHAHHSHMHAHDAPAPSFDRTQPSSVPLSKKLFLAAGFALVTPIGMAIGIGVLKKFNGNDPSTLIAIGTLDALSAGILVWVGLVEMWAHDWMLGGELTDANALTTTLSLFGLVTGMVLMSLLGKWA
ncbi:ZIP zinc transporter-domain-containing protein [Thelonectria olida]|uniref:ZIP zinc transporter-domain-containing protein n=1 Tax=Thelonectria olida TaxID=1576542 RepID=A0A9P8W132_9HYPO|nr:ZIP zinc transporter-domain-containing protein [Thelonectria olida]